MPERSVLNQFVIIFLAFCPCVKCVEAKRIYSGAGSAAERQESCECAGECCGLAARRAKTRTSAPVRHKTRCDKVKVKFSQMPDLGRRRLARMHLPALIVLSDGGRRVR